MKVPVEQGRGHWISLCNLDNDLQNRGDFIHFYSDTQQFLVLSNSNFFVFCYTTFKAFKNTVSLGTEDAGVHKITRAGLYKLRYSNFCLSQDSKGLLGVLCSHTEEILLFLAGSLLLLVTLYIFKLSLSLSFSLSKLSELYKRYPNSSIQTINSIQTLNWLQLYQKSTSWMEP